MILIPREEENEEKLLRATYVLAKKANLDLTFSYLLDPIPDTPLYIIPSVAKNKAIPKGRLEELLGKVKEGSTLYLCADTGLQRALPEIAGVDFAYREMVNKEKRLTLDGVTLPIGTTFAYKPESVRAEVLATDESGDGVFFKHPYGKGTVCLLTLPLEAYLSKNCKQLYSENAYPYDLIYRKVAKIAGQDRVCDSQDPLVRLTEHEAEDGSVTVVAINYSGVPRSTRITVREDYEVEKTLYGELSSDSLSLALAECDGAIFKLKKKA